MTTEPNQRPDDLEIEFECGYDHHSQNNYGEVLFLEGEIGGMETYHRVAIKMVQLNKEDKEDE